MSCAKRILVLLLAIAVLAAAASWRLPPIPSPTPTAAAGNAELDQLLPNLPSVLFDAGAHVHSGYNPVDCCHAGGYNPEPNDVWVSERALASTDRLTYVTVHELAHSVHLRTPRAAALTAAVAGAPVVRAGPWDDSEKVADCVARVLYPRETAASGITYWDCPEPWRGQTRTALGCARRRGRRGPRPAAARRERPARRRCTDRRDRCRPAHPDNAPGSSVVDRRLTR